MGFWVIVLVGVVLLVYVRLAPTDAAKVHMPVTGTQDQDGAGHCIRLIDAGPDGLVRADAAMQALARTQRIAGSVQEGRITYETRSKWIGFPDHTTIEQTDGQLRMFARLRFGRSDFGVNRARLDKIAQAVAA